MTLGTPSDEAARAEAHDRLAAVEQERDALRAEVARLAASERMFRTLVENSPDIIVRYDEAARHLYVNATTAQATGVPAEAWIGKTHVEMGYTPEVAADIAAANARAFATGEPQAVEVVVQHPRGTEIFELRLRPEFHDGRVVSTSVVSRDVTAHRAAVADLATQRAFAERVLDNVPAGVAYLDRKLIYRFSNPVYARFIKMRPEEIVGRYLDDVLPGAVAQTGPWLEEVMATGEPFENTSFRLETYEPSGAVTHTFWDFVYYPDEPDADGHAKGVFVLANEISARLQAERERDEAQRERIKALEEGDRLKDQFLGILSHELRTPINAIMGFGSILDDGVAGELTAEQRAYTRRILGGAETLLALIDDLLDMSRIQAGKFQLTPRPTRVPEVALEVLGNFAPLAERKRLAVAADLAADLPPIDADPQRVAQVLTNLLGNAMKFTPEGGRIEVRLRRSGANLVFEIVDTGVGIAPDDLPKLFRPFVQLEAGNTRSAKGTGLGLSISKALVEAHGGTIGVDSTPGRGSMFWFTLPAPSG